MGHVIPASIIVAATICIIYAMRVWQVGMVSRRRQQDERDARLLGYAASTSNAFLVRVASLEEKVFERLGTLQEKVFMLKGMEPHHLDPKTWMPGGMSREVYEMAQEAFEQPTPPTPTDLSSEAAEHRRRLELDRAEWEAMGKATASDPLG